MMIPAAIQCEAVIQYVDSIYLEIGWIAGFRPSSCARRMNLSAGLMSVAATIAEGRVTGYFA